ncbi:MAG: MoaD/ThiS family protein [Vicinamibacterales bacterium]
MSGLSATAGGAAAESRIRVLIPGLLRSYTAGAHRVDLVVASHSREAAPVLAEVLAALDARCPGLRFRIIDEQGKIRAHIKLFVDGELARDLARTVADSAELMIVGALSGG